MSLEEIKQAVLAGKVVHWKNGVYQVIIDKPIARNFRASDRFLINQVGTTIVWPLTWADGVTMSEDPRDFFLGDEVGQSTEH